MCDLKLELLGSYHWLTESNQVPEQSLWLLSAAAGASYKIDIIEWVPYVALLAGVYTATAEPVSAKAGGPSPFGRTEFGASLALGLDYLLSRNFALGAAVRYHVFFPDPTETQ